jgi:hypothetical protein
MFDPTRYRYHPHVATFADEVCQYSGNFLTRATLEEAPCRELLLQNDLFLKHQ